MSAQHDGSDIKFQGHLPKGPCTWKGINPVNPMAGYWKTYILKSGAEIQPPPPAACGSKEDMSNLQSVLNASNNRTSQQIAAVHHWGDTPLPIIGIICLLNISSEITLDYLILPELLHI